MKDEARAKFNYEHQLFVDPETNEAFADFDGMFPCKKCQGPADVASVNCYYEVYKCLNCSALTHVN